MARQLRIQFPGAFYHVTCRGNERKEIYRTDGDRSTFFSMLSRSREIYGVTLAAYACMPNHFHLLVGTPRANLSEFMRHFNICYTGAFNRKYDRVGHLYQGRYKAFLIDTDNYLLEVSRYIHLNPVKTDSAENIEGRWQWLQQSNHTSLPGFLHCGQMRKNFVDYGILLGFFGGDTHRARQEYQAFVKEGIIKEQRNPLEKGKGTGIIGNDAFIEKIQQVVRGEENSPREQPAVRVLDRTIAPEKLVGRFCSLADVTKEKMTNRGKTCPERAMLMELLYRMCHLTQLEIGVLMGGIDYSAVSQARKRLRQKMDRDPDLAEKFSRILNDIVNCQE